MDWSKVDAALAGALSATPDHGWRRFEDATGAERRLPVFVHVDADAADAVLLAELQVAGPPGGGVRTATLSPADVARLTDQPWVTQVRLSGPLRLLGG